MEELIGTLGIHTEIGRHLPPATVEKILASGLCDKNQDQGSSTTIVAAFDPALTGKHAACRLAYVPMNRRLGLTWRFLSNSSFKSLSSRLPAGASDGICE